MLTKWKVANFKSIKNEVNLDLARLTLLAGSNSSGKSALLQSMLLVSQSISDTHEDRPVILNGSRIQLGRYEDVRTKGSEIPSITVGWEYLQDYLGYEYRTDGPWFDRLDQWKVRKDEIPAIVRVRCELTFGSLPSGGDIHTDPYRPPIRRCMVGAKIQEYSAAATESEIVIEAAADKPRVAKVASKQAMSLYDRLNSKTVWPLKAVAADHTTENELLASSEELQDISQINLCEFRHFLPKTLYYSVDVTAREASEMADWLSGFTELGYPELEQIAAGKVPEGVWDLFRPVAHSQVDSFVLDVQHAVNAIKDRFIKRHYRKSEGSGSVVSVLLGPGAYPRVMKSATIRKLFHSHHLILEQIGAKDASFREQVFHTILKHCREQALPPPHTHEGIELPQELCCAMALLEASVADHIQYIAPLRALPQPFYPRTYSTSDKDVGARGEMTAAVFLMNRHTSITYFPPPASQDSPFAAEQMTAELQTALGEWLRYLEVGTDVSADDSGQLGYELKVTLDGDAVAMDLTNMGFGVSQILPILIMCLLSEPYATILIEQPEVHLHPKVQSRLGDFFLSIAQTGRQCIIETHSEHLVNRLRYRAASAPLESSLTSMMKIYFAERKNGGSVYRDVPVNEYGAIMDWPAGFFDESQDEAERILNAAARKYKSSLGGESTNA